MASDFFDWWTPEEISEINRISAPTDGTFAKLRAQAFEAVIAAHREIYLESVAHEGSRRADVARNFLMETGFGAIRQSTTKVAAALIGGWKVMV